MKPYKTLLILLVFAVLLYGPSMLHRESIRFGDSFSIDLPQAGPYLIPEKEIAADTLQIKPPEIIIDSIISGNSGIEFPDSIDLYQSLLKSLPGVNDHQLRILYYGDSQMEGDRVTDYLRKELRKTNGGTGPGLLSPTMLVPYTRTAYIRSSSNWQRYNYLSYRNGELEHKNMGPLLSLSRFNVDKDKSSEAWIRISPSSTSDSLASTYNTLRIFYGNLKDSLLVEIEEDRKSVQREWLVPVDGATEFKKHLDSPRYVEIRFKGKSSPDIYGLSIESDEGLIVDNIPLRGSAGLEYTGVGSENLRKSFEMLDPDLIILHFGLNIVLNLRDDYTYYENHIFSQIEHLKSICPETRFLLISVTDMAREDESGIHSYPNIPLIVGAQRNAARRSGIMFWDAWQAMGGKDAIVDWRKRDPPLASNDYTHISYFGGHELAAMLCRAIAEPSIKIDTILHAEIVDLEVLPVVEEPEDYSVRSFFGYRSETPLLFTTPEFWIFLFVLLILYSLIFNRPLIRNTYLFLFSLLFYYKSGGIFFVLLILSTITDYTIGWMIHFSRRRAVKKMYLLFSLFVNLAMLGYFKYTVFITGALNDLFGTNIPAQDWLAMISNRQLGTGFDISSIVLPVGISFFTFQTISYTIDVYRNKTKPVRNILDFGFYVAFFPQLVAGPIVRASEFIPQLYQKFQLSKREWGHALFLIVSGLIKKIVVSDYIAVNFVDNIFAAPGAFSGLENLLAVYGYGLQIYCDFSGYTDIAIGVALLMGFRLPVNFNSPYKAVNLSDFWRRWHISLSRWLKDYLYIPLGGNRKGGFRTGINLFLTMILGGLWHGAAWRFFIWGGLHGAGLVVHKIWIRLFPGRKEGSGLGRFVSIFITFNFVTFCWIFFRAEGLESVRIIIDRISTSFSPGDTLGLLKSYSNVLTVIAAGYIIHFLPVKIKEAYRGLFIRMPLLAKIILVYIIAIALYNIQSTDIQPFIYFRF